MTIESHPAYPQPSEVRDMLLAAADRCDRYAADPEFARLIVAEACNEMWPHDKTRRMLAYAATCQVPRTFPETLSAAWVFTLAAEMVNDRICAQRQSR